MQQWKLNIIVILSLFCLFFATAVACSPTVPTEMQQPVSQKPAEFEVGPLTFEPTVVMVGDSVNVTATVKNVGDIAGMYTAILVTDDQQTDKKEITLTPAESSTLEFAIDKLTTGTHTISIGHSQISIDVLPKLKKIAFAHYYNDYYGWEIFTMDPDGTNIKNITNSAAMDLHPTWSPDGTKIAFQSTRESHNLSSIYVMDADGKNVKCLTPEAKICRFPAWSPDGTKIAYCVMKKSGGGSWSGGGIGVFTMASAQITPDAILIMNPDGSNKQYVANGWCPSWFPDSRRIAFMSNYSGIWEIYSSNIYGSDTKKYALLPKARANYGSSLPSCEFPMLAVSPDRSSIAFEYLDNSPDGTQDIQVLKIDTDEMRNLTRELDGRSYCPDWSPDGTKIAFTLDTINGNGIYIMDTDGSNLTKLIENGLWPTWQR